MANGDDAVAAGMDVVFGTDDRRMGYDEINKTRDYIVQYVGKIQAGTVTTGPANVNDYVIVFPEPFTTIPTVVVMNANVAAGQFAIHRVAASSTTSQVVVRLFNLDEAHTPTTQVVSLSYFAMAPF